MSLSEKERAVAVRLRLDAAGAALADARCLLDRGSLRGAANRTYYAAYYGVSALALREGKAFRTHSGLISFFHAECVKTGVLEAVHGRVLQEAFEARTEGDYDDSPALDVEQVARRIQQVDELLGVIRGRMSP